MEENVNIKKTEEGAEHIPLVNLNISLEKEKEERRKLSRKLKQKAGKYVAVIKTNDGQIKSANDLTVKEQEDEFIKCALNPIYFIESYLTVFDQTQGESGKIVPFILFDFQKGLILDYENNRFNVANKYRQAGISTCTCAYIAWYVMFKEDRSVAIVADKLETARDELMADVVDFIDSCPNWLKPKPEKKDTQKLKRYDNGTSLGAFSSKGLRGYTPTLLFWDETAWTEKNDKFWESAGPTLQTGGRAIFVSTPSGLDPVFYKTYEAARRGKSNFNAVLLYWYNDPRYNKELVWLKNKGKQNEIKLVDENWSKERRIQMMDDGWEASSPWFEEQIMNANGDMRKIAQELLGSFLGSGDNFINEKYIKKIEDEEILPPKRQEYVDNNMWIWEDPEPGEDYILIADVSPGYGDDYSSINVLKKHESIEEKVITKNEKSKKVKIRRFKTEQVGEYYGKVTPQQLAEILYQFGKIYNNGYVVVDVTGGYGAQTIEKLIEIGYDNIHYSEITHKPTRDRLSGFVKTGEKKLPDGTIVMVDLIPGFFIGNNRGSILLEMQRAIHLSDVIIRSTRLTQELKTFVTVPGNRVADHKRTFHDDSIIGLAIGLYVINYDMDKFKINKDQAKDLLKGFMTSNDINKKPQLKKSPLQENSHIGNPYNTYSWLFKKPK